MAELTLRGTPAIRHGNLRTRALAAAAVLGLGAALAAGFAWLSRTPTLQVVRLPDGSTLRFVGATYGLQQVFVDGPRWQQLAFPFVGLARAQMWGWRTGIVSMQEPTPVCWIVWSGLATSPGSNCPFELRFTNENGSMTPPDRMRESLWFQPKVPLGIPLTHYPCRGRWLYVEVREINQGRVSPYVRFTLPNPASGSLPQWEAHPLPQTTQAGNATFLLKRFESGVKYPGMTGNEADAAELGTVLQFEAQEGGKPSRRWFPISTSFTTATGDSWEDAAWWVRGMAPSTCWTPRTLGTEEAAWEIGVHFARLTGFTPEETWTFRNVPVPIPGKGMRGSPVLVRGHTSVRLESLQSTRTPSGNWSVVGELRLLMPTAPRMVSIIGIRDERGRDLRDFGENRTRIGPIGAISASNYRFFARDVPAGTRRVQLTLAINHSRYVTFLATPEVAKAAP